MKRWACLVPGLMLVWVVAASSQDPSGPKVSRPITKTPTTAELRKILEEVIELPDEFKQPVPFKLVLKYMVDKIAMKGGEFPFYIEVDTANGDLFDENVYFPPFVGKMSADACLRHCASQLSRSQLVMSPCVHLVRDGRIVLTTLELIHPLHSLDQSVMVHYQAVPIQRIFDDMTDKFGVTIVVDSRSADVLTLPFTVKSNNDLSLRGLLESIADSNDLRLIVDEHRVFLTSRASHLRRLRDRLEEGELIEKTRFLNSYEEPRPRGGKRSAAQ